MMETREPKRGKGFEERYGGPSRPKAVGLWAFAALAGGQTGDRATTSETNRERRWVPAQAKGRPHHQHLVRGDARFPFRPQRVSRQTVPKMPCWGPQGPGSLAGSLALLGPLVPGSGAGGLLAGAQFAARCLRDCGG